MKRIVNEPKEIDGIRVVQDSFEMVEALMNGETIYHWEFGTSLAPLINNGEYCKITPCSPIDVKRGDCVFCIIRSQNGQGFPMVHQVWEISDCGYDKERWFKIGSTMSTIFGWTKEVYGIARGTNIYQEVTDEILKELEKEE